jgi:hypothetical protein
MGLWRLAIDNTWTRETGMSALPTQEWIYVDVDFFFVENNADKDMRLSTLHIALSNVSFFFF